MIYGATTEAHTLNLSDNMGVPPLYGYAHTTPETDTAPKVVDHSVTITGLTPGTTYFFRCVSRGSFAVSTELSLTTTGVAGVTTAQATPGAGAPSETPGEEIPPEGIGGIGTPEATPETTPVISPEVAGAAAVGGFGLGNLCWLLLAVIIILLILYLLSVLSKKRGRRKKKRGWILPLATAVLIILYCIFCCSSCGSIFCCKICWILIAALIVITLIPLLFGKKQ